MKYLIIAIVFIVLLSGCIDNVVQQTGGLETTMIADPPEIFINRPVTIYLDIENTDTKNLHDVYTEFFDTGILLGKCDSSNLSILLPEQFKTISCTLLAPQEIAQNRATTEISSLVRFNTEFSLVQLVEMVSEQYYELHLGEIERKPSSYVYKDKNIQVDIEFSDALPVVVRPEKKAFMYITIKNIGNGFITFLHHDAFSLEPVRPQSEKIVECDFPDLVPTDREFPRIACEMRMPENVEYIYNHDVIFSLSYEYEVRDKTTVNIVR